VDHNPRALIIGGSVGGLFAANLLRNAGWDVLVFERAAEGLASRGAAIGITEELIEVMQRIGVRLDYSIGIKVCSFISLDRSGVVTHEIRRHQVTGAWANVYGLLKDTLPLNCYRSGTVLDRIVQDGRTVTAIFADGSQARGDLLIGADGVNSTVRRQLLPDVAPRYAGYIAWRGIVVESDVLPADRDLIFDHITFCFPEGEMLLCIPFPGDDAVDARGSSRRCCYVWYRPVDYKDALPQLCTDSEGLRHGVSIPPPLIRSEVIRELKADAEDLFSPSIARIVARAHRPLFQAVFDLESPRIVFGRVVLLGDAAFVARPHAAAGVTKAALDARCLAAVLNNPGVDLGQALAYYDRERRDFGTKLVAHARQLGTYLEAKVERQMEQNDMRLARRPEIVLRDYGAPHLFRS
jgi:2-polyprenyl-6-methoxyphenol hydroxylase-like FAD-dependent oxidoreductase